MAVPFCNGFRSCREINEPVMINQAKLPPSIYTNRVVHLFTVLLQSIVHIC